MGIISYPWPRSFHRSKEWSLSVNGEPVDILHSTCGAFVIIDGDGPAEVTLDAIAHAAPLNKATVKPLRHQIDSIVNDRRISFTLPHSMDIAVDVPGIGDVFIFYGPTPSAAPDASDPLVHYYKAGQVYEVGQLEIKAHETLYVEGGAVLRGAILFAKSDKAQAYGRGIIDNTYFKRGCAEGTRNPFLAEHSKDITLSELTFVESNTWSVKTAACKGVHIDGIRILARLIAADGIDITGTEDALVENCFVRSGDDCFAVKSVEYGRPGPRTDYCVDVVNVRFQHCVAYSYGGGSALELGHEFRCKSVKNISFEDIDVLAVHEYGAALSISHCDDALIEDVFYKNIRIEHHYHELIGFKIVKSEYKPSEERGHVRNIQLEDIFVDVLPCNHGYSCSHIGGWDDEHAFENINITNMQYGDVAVKHLDDFDCYTKYARNISIS